MALGDGGYVSIWKVVKIRTTRPASFALWIIESFAGESSLHFEFLGHFSEGVNPSQATRIIHAPFVKELTPHKLGRLRTTAKFHPCIFRRKFLFPPEESSKDLTQEGQLERRLEKKTYKCDFQLYVSVHFSFL